MEQNQDCQQDEFEIGDLVYLKSQESTWFLNDNIGIIARKPDQENYFYLIYVYGDFFPAHPTVIKNIKEYENVLCRSNDGK